MPDSFKCPHCGAWVYPHQVHQDCQRKQDEKRKQSSAGQARDFDPDLPPLHPTNQQAGSDRGFSYNRTERVWEDDEGCPVRDEFGQDLG